MVKNKNKTYIQNLTENISSGNWKKSIFNWNFFFVFLGPLLAILILFLVRLLNLEKMPIFFTWTMFIIFVPWITCSLVESQRKKLVGNYGETILILIPTFVWLLAGYEQAIRWLVIIAAIIISIGAFAYFIAMFRKVKFIENRKTKERITSILIHVAFVCSSVVSTVSLSVVLLDWGNEALNIVNLGIDGQPDYTSTGWILFIALVTVAVSLLLVILGLLSNAKIVDIEQKKYPEKLLKKGSSFKDKFKNGYLMNKWKLKAWANKIFGRKKWKRKKD